MSTAAPPTSYDLNFRLLGVPVRVHPFFWLFSAMLGLSGNQDDLSLVALWVGCVFLSILVHEFGHALMGKRFGGSPSILLYSLGGLCYSGSERTPWQRLAVILAGPGAGFLLFLATLIAAGVVDRISPVENLAMVLRLMGLPHDPESYFGGRSKLGDGMPAQAYFMMVQINLYWTIINLLPIWPLDGGQATQVVLSQVDRRNGVRRSHIISFLTAGALAIFLGVRSGSLFITLFMGYFAYTNFQILQSMHEAKRFGYQQDDWWRK
ncbi:site-2 protease family protein [Paludisphaera mucosa]|uniref:Site-2 protease family protein n=1 Tax=Paludisphaera mucosa TaxID=3030827 RepID=A0ABT6FF60_9BACT|nr:M50 family metallopeptidase [Paludisphaera mucosa]MDG3006204.1 site-2 protease family protein [Paludisphaera mucosa]